MLITVTPVRAATLAELAAARLPEAARRPLAGCAAGARSHEGALAGALGRLTAGQAQPRLPWTAVDAGGASARGGYQPVSPKHFEQMTRINPVSTGGMGPHPEREPEPV